jgi:RimJ/RimL family protein N-acetyltransferase
MQLRFEPFDEEWLDDVTKLVTDPDVLNFTRVPEPVNGRFLGLALAPHVDAAAGEMELGYIVAPAARGRGVARAILRKLTRWAFEERGAQRIHLIIDVQNVASERVAERCGYRRERVMRSARST